MELMDMPLDEFMASLPELEQMGYNRDELIRMYRAQNSPMAPVNAAAAASAQEIADAGRRPVAGGLFSKEVGTTGWDALSSLNFEGWNGLTQAGAGIGQAADAPWAAANNLMPQGDMALEALNLGGVAMLGGGAAVAPRGSLRAGLSRNVGESKAQNIARLLREGKASEVTDDMLATLSPNDNAELFRLYDEGATGMDLPMDVASRAARASDAGFGTGRNRMDPIAEMRGEQNPQLVHYTNKDFPAFEIPEAQNRQAIWATPDPHLNLATKSNWRSFDEEGVNGIPIVARMNNRVSPLEFREAGDPMTPAFPSNVTAHDVAKANSVGADHASAGMEYAIFDPRNIRSTNARFDPRLSGNADLLAANANTSGGLLATAASDALTPSQQMARRILDMRAAGRARDVTDDMMAQADPQVMFNETPLPMDAASRAARADELFPRDGYHGSTHVFDRFGGGNTRNIEGHFGAGDYITSSADDASRHYAGEGPDLTQRVQMRAEQIADELGVDYDSPEALSAARAELSGGTDGIMYPVRYKTEKPFDISDDGNTFLEYDQPRMDPEDYLDEAGGDMDLAEELAMDDSYNFEPEGELVNFMDALRYDPRVSDADGLLDTIGGSAADGGLLGRDLDEIMRGNEWYSEDDFGGLANNEVYRNALQGSGFDSITHSGNIFRGMDVEPGTTHTILNNPQNIRSQFARFDPEFAHLSNLSAANADYLTGLVASGASDEEVQAAYQMILDLEGPR